jgi:hypothetical protein
MVVDTRGKPLNSATFATDFMALQFVLGRPLPLRRIFALDEHYGVVGATDPGFATESIVPGNARPPVPDERDHYADFGQTAPKNSWVPEFFERLVSKLQEEGEDSRLATTMSAYLDSLTGNVHVNYLLAQIALEPFCAKIVKSKSGVLVTNRREWSTFVDRNEKEIRSLALDEEAGQKLVNKVGAAFHAPSTDRVDAALDHFSLRVPDQVRKEIRGRNRAAHEYIMARESTANFQVLADRTGTIQTLLVAVIAKHIDYDGPILGWEWVHGRRKIPEWWLWTKRPESRRSYRALIRQKL